MTLRTSRNAGVVTSIALGLALSALPASAQVPPPSTPSSPSDSPGAVPAPGNRVGSTGMLEGSVKKIDPGAGTLQVAAGPLGILGRTLEVDSNTQIQVEGREGTLADLQEGTKVKAAYETREGKSVATRIEVVPAQQ